MSAKKNIADDIPGYEPFESALPEKKKKPKPKKPKPVPLGKQYNPLPKNTGKMYNPMDVKPSGFAESFDQLVVKYLTLLG